MKQVSKAYSDSMRAALRNQSLVRITFQQVDPDAATDGSWTTDSQLWYSAPALLDNVTLRRSLYATLELNFWELSGTRDIVPDESPYNEGFVSNGLSDENGTFSASPVLSKVFTAAHALPGLTLSFNSQAHALPRNVTLTYVHGASSTMYPPDSISQNPSVLDHAGDVDMIEIKFGSTLPYHRMRLSSVEFGIERLFENDDIISLKQSTDVDPLSRRLPKETFQFTIADYEHRYDPDRPNGAYRYLHSNAPITVQFGYTLPSGEVEWLKPDRYLLDGKPTVSNSQATFSCVGLLGSMTGTFYKDHLGIMSFYAKAEAVLQDAGLATTPSGENPWIIDESLKNMYTTAALPIDTHANCLQLIAHACCCRLFTDDDNIIHIEPFTATVQGLYDGTWSDNGHVPYSEWGTVDNPSFDNFITTPTLELNRWVLDGESTNEGYTWNEGYVGISLSGEDGTFQDPPVVTRTFDVPHDLRKITVGFDMVLEEYPESIVVRYYAGSTLLDTKTVSPITSPTIEIYHDKVVACTSIEISPATMSPYRRFRIGTVSFSDTDFTLDNTSIQQDSESISQLPSLQAVEVVIYNYRGQAENSTLFEGTTDQTSMHVEFSEPATGVKVSCGSSASPISYGVYARAVDISNMLEGTKTVTVTGYRASQESSTITKPVAASGEIDRETNCMITSLAMANALAEHVATYLSLRNTYDVDYRGNPELEAGDHVLLQTPYSSGIDGIILVDEITFDGSLHGNVKVKGLI